MTWLFQGTPSQSLLEPGPNIGESSSRDQRWLVRSHFNTRFGLKEDWFAVTILGARDVKSTSSRESMDLQGSHSLYFDRIALSTCRSESLLRKAALLSKRLFPRASAISTLAHPSLIYILVGTMVRPLVVNALIILLICRLCSNNLRARSGSC